MTKKKPERVDCVAVKRQAQKPLAKALAGKSPAEQVETIHRLASRTPTWASLAEATPGRTPRAVRQHAKRRSTG